MKVFSFNNELYIRCIPGKRLFNSTLVHEVVNRGDIFALRVRDQQLTIISGTANVEHWDAELGNFEEIIANTTKPGPTAEQKAMLDKLRNELWDSVLRKQSIGD